MSSRALLIRCGASGALALAASLAANIAPAGYLRSVLLGAIVGLAFVLGHVLPTPRPRRAVHAHTWLKPTFPGGTRFCSCGARADDRPVTP